LADRDVLFLVIRAGGTPASGPPASSRVFGLNGEQEEAKQRDHRC